MNIMAAMGPMEILCRPPFDMVSEVKAWKCSGAQGFLK